MSKPITIDEFARGVEAVVLEGFAPERQRAATFAALQTLARNLEIGSALCEAFVLGGDSEYDEYVWWPGCQRAAR